MICQVFFCYPMQRELVTNLIYDHLANWAWECTRKQDSSTKIFNSKWLYDWTHPKTSSGYFPFEHTPEALRQEYPDGLTVVTILDEFDDILCATLNSGYYVIVNMHLAYRRLWKALVENILLPDVRMFLGQNRWNECKQNVPCHTWKCVSFSKRRKSSKAFISKIESTTSNYNIMHDVNPS